MSKNTKNKLTVLVIAPHHDDEAIGLGGTILYMIECGHDVRVAHVFDGSSGVCGVMDKNQSCTIREHEAKQAAMIAGYKLLPNLGFADRNRDRDKEIQASLIKLIRSEKPNVVFIPHIEETDYEHSLVSKEGREALWLASSEISPELGENVAETPMVLYYEVWKNISSPTVYCNITSYIDRKRKMLEIFTSQMEASGWVNGAIGHNAYRGVTMLGRGYVEAFSTEKISIEKIIRG